MAPSSIGELACLRQGHQVFQPEADHPLGGIPAKDMFYVYILKSTVKDVYYIGSTEDLRKRLAEHNQGKTKSIRHLVPLELKYYEAYSTRTLARKRNSFKKKEVLERIEP
jgi:putative endonuclease